MHHRLVFILADGTRLAIPVPHCDLCPDLEMPRSLPSRQVARRKCVFPTIHRMYCPVCQRMLFCLLRPCFSCASPIYSRQCNLVLVEMAAVCGPFVTPRVVHFLHGVLSICCSHMLPICEIGSPTGFCDEWVHRVVSVTNGFTDCLQGFSPFEKKITMCSVIKRPNDSVAVL